VWSEREGAIGGAGQQDDREPSQRSLVYVPNALATAVRAPASRTQEYVH